MAAGSCWIVNFAACVGLLVRLHLGQDRRLSRAGTPLTKPDSWLSRHCRAKLYAWYIGLCLSGSSPGSWELRGPGVWPGCPALLASDADRCMGWLVCPVKTDSQAFRKQKQVFAIRSCLFSTIE